MFEVPAIDTVADASVSGDASCAVARPEEIARLRITAALKNRYECVAVMTLSPRPVRATLVPGRDGAFFPRIRDHAPVGDHRGRGLSRAVGKSPQVSRADSRRGRAYSAVSP